MKQIDRLKQLARKLKRDVHAVWLAARDARTPWSARLLALVIAAYAFSPIDLIPDFIPILGYLDDLVIVPLGIILVVRLVPEELMNEFRLAASLASERPVSRVAAVVIILFWLALLVMLARLWS